MKEDAPADLEGVVVRYMPYLSEIRKRLLFVISLFFVGWILGFLYYQPIVKLFMSIYDLTGVNITFTSPFAYLTLALNTGMLVGVILVLPLFIFQLIQFLRPALQNREYRLVMGLVPFSILLFLFGLSFGIWMMKFIISLYSTQTNQLDVGNLWDINRFLSQVIQTSMLLGFVFQLPLLLTILLRLGVVGHKAVTKQRIPIYIGLMSIAILLPPTDLFSLFIMFFPLALIFEVTLLLNRNIQAKPARVHSA
jgi:sec-independent protein translocase protein TatC